MRLIDVDALEEVIDKGIKEPMYQHEEEDWYDGMINAENLIKEQPTIEPQRWIPCSERMPECEQEVLICTKKKIYISKNSGFDWCVEPIITPALYEDGTMLEVNSKWIWEDIDYAGWNEEEDCGIIPEGWWENRHFNPDDIYNNVVDREVVAWMPLPAPYRLDDFSQHMNPPEE